jgi:hypothetical protein
MKQFIINVLNTFGLGVNGNINNINLFRVKHIFPCSTFTVVESGSKRSIVNVVDDATGSTFTLVYEHTEKGRITNVSFND